MLNKFDISFMEESVQDIIHLWDTKIMIYNKSDISTQPYYNSILREFTGDILCTRLEIDAERKDLINNQTNIHQEDDIEYGIKNEGTILFAIPDVLNNVKYKPSQNDIITIDDSGEVYYIKSIRDRIGESLITIKRFVGNTPKIITVDDKIYIRDYEWRT